MVGVRADSCWIVAVHGNGPLKRDKPFQQFRAAREMHFAVASNGFEVEPASELVVQREVADVNGRINHWSIHTSRTLQREISGTLCRQFIQMNLADASEIEIPTVQVQPESVGVRVVRGYTLDGRVLVREPNVVQRGF